MTDVPHDLLGEDAPEPCTRPQCWCRHWIDLPDQTCGACGREHPGADCAPPTLLEEL